LHTTYAEGRENGATKNFSRRETFLGLYLVQAEIDKTGKPSSVKILSGHPILAAAVLEAVRQWRWKPLKLNGMGVETETTITVKFEPK